MGGRAIATVERPPIADRYRLRRSIELFQGPGDRLYLLRLGAGDDQLVEDPSPEERAALLRLSEGFAGLPELEAHLAEAGFDPGAASVAIEDLSSAGLLEVREQPRRLGAEAAERFDRQLLYLADLAPAGTSPELLQQRLAEATVVIIGCGGLGSWVATGLALAGVGALVLIDDDRVELSNLNRQLLFGPEQIGQLKVEAAAARLVAHNPALDVTVSRQRIGSSKDVSALLAADVSLVVSTGDFPPHKLPRWVNQACLDAGVPWLGAGQFPPRLRVGPLVVPGASACLECLELETCRAYPLYEAVARFRDQRATPDPSVGPISAVIGSLLANEAMLHLVGRRPASFSRALVLDLETMAIERQLIARQPDCPACG